MKVRFCVLNKPEKILTHPRKLSSATSMLDFIKHRFGKDANPVHRLDYETSGLLLCSIDRYSEIYLKDMFSSKKVKKEYIAMVWSQITRPVKIVSQIHYRKDRKNLSVKAWASNTKIWALEPSELTNNLLEENTKDIKLATSIVVPVKAYKRKTLVKMIPITGRTHQLRVHASLIKAPIIGDPLYGPDENISSAFLDLRLGLEEKYGEGYENAELQENTRKSVQFKKLSKIAKIEKAKNMLEIREAVLGSKRLMLHSRKIELLGHEFTQKASFEDTQGEGLGDLPKSSNSRS